jgi:hypothetical protein
MRLVAIVLAMLAIPLIGMQLSADIAWSTADFVIAAVGLFGAGIVYELMRLLIVRPRQRVLAGIGITVMVFIGWVELAVGVFGTPFAGS